MSWVPFPRKRHLLILLLLILLGQVIGGVAVLLVNVALTGEPSGVVRSWFMPVYYLLSFAPAVYYTWSKLERPTVSFFLIQPLSPKYVAVLGIAILLVSFGVGIVAGYLPTADLVNASMDSLGVSVGSFITIVLLAPVVEEYLLRGLLLDRMLQHRSPRMAIFLSALLFGLMHLIPAHVFMAFFMGLALGYVYYRTRSLALVILLHLINNGTAFAGKLVGLPEENPYGPVVMIGIAAAATALGAWLLRYGADRVTPLTPAVAAEEVVTAPVAVPAGVE